MTGNSFFDSRRIAAGADVDAQDKDGYTPLINAARYGAVLQEPGYPARGCSCFGMAKVDSHAGGGRKKEAARTTSNLLRTGYRGDGADLREVLQHGLTR